MQKSLAISLAIGAILATLMLQWGDDSPNATLISSFAFIVIVFGLIIVDLKKWFALSEFWSNVLIVAVVVAHLGGLVNRTTEFLAFSIANILVYIQMILFFRPKTVRVSFQLLMLAFLQVGVGSVSEQSIWFAILLLAYCFAVICSLTLLFLSKEKLYYQSHVFLQPSFGREKSREKKTVGHLGRLALRALLLTPYYVLFGAHSEEYETFLTKKTTWGTEKGVIATFSLFLQRFQNNPRVLIDFFRKPIRAYDAYEQNVKEQLSQGRQERDRFISNDSLVSRFPLLYQSPVFLSNAARGQETLINRGLIRQLFLGATFSLLIALMLFVLFPRFDRLEIGGLRLGHDGWRTAATRINSLVGFNETMKLGDLGPSGENHQTVLTIRFADAMNPENSLLASGTPVYLRGATLVRYQDRQWNRLQASDSLVSHPHFMRDHLDRNFFEPVPAGDDLSPLVPERTFSTEFSGEEANDRLESDRSEIGANHAPFPKVSYQMGQIFRSPEEWVEGIFDPGNQLICQEIELLPMTSTVAFAVWPFFRMASRREVGLFDDGWFIRGTIDTFRRSRFNLYTNAFRDSVQVDLIPNQENVLPRLKQFLEIDQQGLTELIRLAKKWDNEAEIPKEDTIARAKHLERMLKSEAGFSYSRAGVLRNRRIDPLEDFVTKNPQGHCEYFAGTLAMMLRAVGIPSRIVVGFLLETNPSTSGTNTVRQSDAHSWVEAYISKDELNHQTAPGVFFPTKDESLRSWWSNGAWLRLDATPAAARSFSENVSINYFAFVSSLQEFWQNNVMNFNSQRQQNSIYEPALAFYRSVRNGIVEGKLWKETLPELGRRVKHFLKNITQGKWNTSEFLTTITPFALLILLRYGLYRFIRHFRQISFQKRRTVSKVSRQVAFFSRLEHFFFRLGIPRRPEETAKEYIARCTKNEQGESIIESSPTLPPLNIAEIAAEITDAYYRVRYGTQLLSPVEKGRINSLLDLLDSQKLPVRY